MKCPKCQFENPEGAKFCIECAHPMEFHCPNCGAITPATGKFCKECAFDLKTSQKPHPIDFNQPQSYTPKHLADKILTTRSAIEGERKLVTVMFADVAGFTSMSEKMEPEEVHQIMEGCLKILMDEIHKYEGTINQFTGDGVMALFGAPLAHEDHAQRACYASLTIQKELADYGEKIRTNYGQEFRMRIGLNSGSVVVGSIGDDLHMDYTAIGDTINLASRMEGLAKPGSVLLSRNTQRLVSNYFDMNSLGTLEVKGKEEPQEAYELTRVKEVATRFEASLAKGLTRFVGRENSMGALMEAYEKVRNGSGQVVDIVGEAGVGKSRLLFEFKHRLPQDTFGYLEGHCLHYGGAMPYLPLPDILRSFFEVWEGEREMVIRKRIEERILGLDEKLQGCIPPIQDLLSLKVEDEDYLKLEPKRRRERVFEALRDLIVRSSQERPLILAFEDLHWIDKTSEEFLDYLIGWLANIKVLLILLHRPEYTPRWGSKSYFNRIGVDQLTLKSSAELVRAILEGGDTAPELSNLILNRAAGNPLFMEELTHSLLENGSIKRNGDQYVLSKKASDLQVPDTIQGIIAARIDRLEENLKRIMQVASVIGREFAFRILQAISDMREDLKSQLLNLQGLELIYEKSLFPELEYVFKHALTQEVAYNSLLSNQRKSIHKRIGRAIEELYAGNLDEFYEVLAYHSSKSDESGKAIQYFKWSGEKAFRNYANWEAYEFYKEAVRLLNKLPDTAEKKEKLTEVLLLMANPLAFLGMPEESLPYLQQGERLAKELGNSGDLADFYSALGIYYTWRGDHLTAFRYSEEKGFEEARKIEDVDLMASFGVSLCNTYWTSGRHKENIDKMPEVIHLIEKTGRESDCLKNSINPYSFISGFTGQALSFLGRFEEAKLFLEKAFKNAEKLGDPFHLGLTLQCYGVLYWLKGDWELAKEYLEKSLKYYEEAKFFIGVFVNLMTIGYLYSYLGDAETGRRQAEKGFKLLRDSGIEGYLPMGYYVMGSLYLNLEDMERAETSMEEALRFARKNGEKIREGSALVGLGRVYSKKENREIEKAEECFSQGVAILQDQELKPLYANGRMFQGEFYLDNGWKEKATENLKEAEALFQEMGIDYWLDRTKALLVKS